MMSSPVPLALLERATALLASRGRVSEEQLLAHVYGACPPQPLRARLLEPLLAAGGMERDAGGQMRLTSIPTDAGPRALRQTDWAAISVLATGPRPGRDQVAAVAAVLVEAGQVRERFTAAFPTRRQLPAYVAMRGRIPRHSDAESPEPIDLVLPRLMEFFGERPIWAQEPRLAWSFLTADARRAGILLPSPVLLDVNTLAARLLPLPGKPTLAAIAALLKVNYVHVGEPAEEARVIAQVIGHLVAQAEHAGLTLLTDLTELAVPGDGNSPRPVLLRDPRTAHGLPEQPGVYVLRSAETETLYVGKARRLRERLAAYTSRPLGPTRRLEGLAEEVASIEPFVFATDLEALVQEQRHIRALLPRYNTQRQVHAWRTWLRLDLRPALTKRGRPRALPRIHLRLELTDDGASYLGAFRNSGSAREARNLARVLFQLDLPPVTNPDAYLDRLQTAWGFLDGNLDAGIAAAQTQLRSAAGRGDYDGIRTWRKVLRRAIEYDLGKVTWPADPRLAQFAVIREDELGREVFLIDRGYLTLHVRVNETEGGEMLRALVDNARPMTHAEDVEIVLQWLGAQRAPARLVYLPPETDIALALSTALAAPAETRP